MTTLDALLRLVGLTRIPRDAAPAPHRTALDTRFADERELWRAELRRAQAVLDVRLKHIENHLQ